MATVTLKRRQVLKRGVSYFIPGAKGVVVFRDILANPYLLYEQHPEIVSRLRSAIGRPLGDDRFLSEIEARLGRSLRPRPRGRKRGSRTSGESGPVAGNSHPVTEFPAPV